MIKEKQFHKLPSLDGWRAVSIAGVLLEHSTITTGFPIVLKPAIFIWLQPGNLGVRFFFVISGFLITYLLLQEQAKHGFISLNNFYFRRALRILPVYFLYLGVLGFFTKYSQNATAWLANLTFTTNFLTIPHPTDHLWSLGVEEQFYLLWPWLLVMVSNGQNDRSKLLKMLFVPLMVAPVVRMLDCKQWYPEALHFLFQGGSFFARFDSLSYGCLTAVLFINWRDPVETFFRRHSSQIAWAGVALILAPVGLRLLHLPGSLEALGFESMQAIGFSLLLLQSMLYPKRGFYRFLNWKWVSHIGILSYSIYIWQQMFCGTSESVFGVKEAWWVSFPVWILVALMAAHASYYLLEKPLLALRSRLRPT